MNQKIIKSLPVGREQLVLVESEERDNENIYRIDEHGAVVWCVAPDVYAKDDSPYVNITLQQNGTLLAMNWDGNARVIDVATGKVIDFIPGRG